MVEEDAMPENQLVELVLSLIYVHHLEKVQLRRK
jgi:hypothetical protein